MTKTTAETVIAAIAEYGNRPADQITPTTALADLDLDSLDLIELAMEIEEATSSDLSKTDLATLTTVADLITATEQALA